MSGPNHTEPPEVAATLAELAAVLNQPSEPIAAVPFALTPDTAEQTSSQPELFQLSARTSGGHQ